LSLRILYVDDEEFCVRPVTRELRAAGCIVTSTTSPLEAADHLRREPFDVVLSDFVMPGMDGVDLLGEAYRLRPNARRLLLTGTPDEAKVRAAFAEGLVERVLAKPVAIAELLEAVGVPTVRPRRTPTA
jgi:CheY-like chemotaxis protein